MIKFKRIHYLKGTTRIKEILQVLFDSMKISPQKLLGNCQFTKLMRFDSGGNFKLLSHANQVSV